METHVYRNGQVDPLFLKYRKKIVLDYNKLRKIAEGYQALGQKIVVTIGSWDALHIGHVRYIIKAHAAGDILIVALDSDQAIQRYKGPLRPLIPENERAEMLTYLGELVSFVTVIEDVDNSGWWQCGLLKVVQPDVFVAVEDSYPQEQLEEIRRYVWEVVVLPRQAENTSTSALIEKTLKQHFLPAFQEALETTLSRKTPTRPGPVSLDAAPEEAK